MSASSGIAVDEGPAEAIRRLLLVVNRSSGTGLGDRLVAQIESRFVAGLDGTAKVEIRTVTDHAGARAAAKAFASSSNSPVALIAGGGGGTLRAVVEGVWDAKEDRGRGMSLAVGALRLGSGNVVAKQFGVPLDPLKAAEEIAASVRQGRTAPCSIMRCRMGKPGGEFDVRYGVTMCGVGQFGRVPGDLVRWPRRLPRIRRFLTRGWGLERINDLEYLTAIVTRTCWASIWPLACELVELRVQGRAERLRILAGVVMNFPIKVLPFDPGVRIEEPSLSFHYVPARHPPVSWGMLTPKRLVANLRSVTLGPGDCLEVRYLDREAVEFFLDEDPELAYGGLMVEPAGLLPFIPCQQYFSRKEAGSP